MADDSQLEYEDEERDEQPAQRPAVGQDTGSDLPIKQGAVFGAITLLATYLSHLFLTAIMTARLSPANGYVGEAGDQSLVVSEMIASWQSAGWSYLSVFGVGFEAEGESATLSDATNHGAAVLHTPFELADTLLFLVTFGAIVVAGYAVARHTGAEDAIEAAKAGVIVALPYFVFALLAALVITHTFTEGPAVDSVASSVAGLESGEFSGSEGHATSEVEFGPSVTGAILYAGIIVPVVLGTLGGVIAQREDALEKLMAKVDQF